MNIAYFLDGDLMTSSTYNMLKLPAYLNIWSLKLHLQSYSSFVAL